MNSYQRYPWKPLLISLLVLSGGCDPEPLQIEQLQEEDASCSAEQLFGATVLAEREFVRETGKPVVESLGFELGEGASDVCVIIVNGGLDANGGITHAPASLEVDLDGEVSVASPSDFNAHPKTVIRSLGDVAEGTHSLDVELRGKPSTRAHVSVLARAGGSPNNASLAPITTSRMQRGYGGWSLEDEAIVVFDEDPVDPAGVFAQLPFPAFAVSRLHKVPIFRVYLPGAGGGEDLEQMLGQISSLPGVTNASLHRLDVTEETYLPVSGDDSYVEGPANARTLTDEAWHLEQMNAPQAWTPSNTTTSAVVGVVDNGFNVDHPGFREGGASNLAGCWTTDGTSISKSTCTSVAAELAADEDSCWKAFWGWSDEQYHGTGVAGMLGARDNDVSDQGFADTLGVVWDVDMHFARTAQLDIVVDDDSIFQDFDDSCVADTRVSSNYGMLLLIEEMIQTGVETLNFSFSIPLLEKSGALTPDYDNHPDPVQALADIVKEHDKQWSRLLRAYPRALVVQAAGNHGDHCGSKDDSFCETRASGFGCAVSDDDLAKQVLCVGASTESAKVSDMTNRGGDLIAAPGEAVHVMSYDGGLKETQGTSFSAPLVAGAAALIRGTNPQLNPRVLHDVLLTGGRKSALYDNGKRYRLLDLLASTQQATRCAETYASFEEGVEGCPTFSDVEFYKWYHDPIERLSCNCVISGHPNGEFKPYEDLNRAEAIKIIFEIAFPDETFPAPAQDPFDDVDKDKWFAGYAHFGRVNDLVTVQDDNLFHPDAAIKRKDFAVIMRKASELSGVDELVRLHENYLAIKNDGFVPDHQFEDATIDANPSVYTLASRCIMTGKSEGHFGADEHLNRAEASKAGCLAIYGFGSMQCGEDSSACTPETP